MYYCCWVVVLLWTCPLLLLLPLCVAQRDASSLMGLISTKDIAELTQIATELAAQTMHSNGELMSKPGRPEVRDLSLNASPSQLLGQGLTNMWQPASQQLAKSLMGQQPAAMASAKQLPLAETQPLFSAPRYNSRPRAAATAGTGGGAMNSIMELASTFLGGADRTAGPARTEAAGVGTGNQMSQLIYSMTGGSRPASASSGGMGELISSMTGGNRPPTGANQMGELISSMTGGNRPANGGNQMMIPSLKQIMPGASRNFGFQQGEGCLPFIGEFMSVIYGNCVRQADEKTWDTWGKEITNALMGGKIDLLRASKETCKKGAEREQCGQLRRAVSECDIIGSIQLASNMQRAISRCDEISGIIDQHRYLIHDSIFQKQLKPLTEVITLDKKQLHNADLQLTPITFQKTTGETKAKMGPDSPNPTTVLTQMNGLINGEMAQGFLNNFLG